MKTNTTAGRWIGRRTYLKALGAGGLATSVAGCLGAEADTRSGSNEKDSTNGSPTTSGGAATETATADRSEAGDRTESGETNAKPEFATYTNSEDGYSIEHPTDWKVIEGSPESTTSVSLESSTGLELVKVFVGGTGGMTADELVEEVIAGLGEDSEVLSRKEMPLSGGQTGRFFEYKVVSDEAGIVNQEKILFVVTDDTADRVDGTSIGGNHRPGNRPTSERDHRVVRPRSSLTTTDDNATRQNERTEDRRTNIPERTGSCDPSAGPRGCPCGLCRHWRPWQRQRERQCR